MVQSTCMLYYRCRKNEKRRRRAFSVSTTGWRQRHSRSYTAWSSFDENDCPENQYPHDVSEVSKTSLTLIPASSIIKHAFQVFDGYVAVVPFCFGYWRTLLCILVASPMVLFSVCYSENAFSLTLRLPYTSGYLHAVAAACYYVSFRHLA